MVNQAGPYEELFEEDFRKLREEMQKLAHQYGLTFGLRQAETFREGAVRLSRKSLWVEMLVRTPEELGGEAERAGAWGLEVRDWIGVRSHYLARWPDGWRSWDGIRNAWRESELVRDVKGRVLGRLLGEIVVEGWRSSAEDWREAQKVPRDALPITEQQRQVARHLGIPEEDYARSALAGTWGQNRLVETARRLGALLQRKLEEKAPGMAVLKISLDTFREEYRVELAREGGTFDVRMSEDFVGSLLEAGSGEAERQIEQILDRAIANQAA